MTTLFADVALARRLEGNKSMAALEYSRAQELLRPRTTSVLSVAGGNVVFVGETSPISRAMGLGMQEPLTADQLDAVEEFFLSRGMTATLEFCPLADPSLRILLNQRGYRIHHFRNVLVLPLAQDLRLPPPSSEATITEALSAEEKREWLFTVARGFLAKNDVVPEETWITQPMTAVPAVRCYLAQLGSEPVGGGAMAVRNGLAHLSSTSVRSDYRNQGIQSSLVWTRLNDAVQAGCDLAMVETSPGSPSQRNLERFGFRVVYTTMSVVRE